MVICMSSHRTVAVGFFSRRTDIDPTTTTMMSVLMTSFMPSNSQHGSQTKSWSHWSRDTSRHLEEQTCRFLLFPYWIHNKFVGTTILHYYIKRNMNPLETPQIPVIRQFQQRGRSMSCSTPYHSRQTRRSNDNISTFLHSQTTKTPARDLYLTIIRVQL